MGPAPPMLPAVAWDDSGDACSSLHERGGAGVVSVWAA
jgi:hypothetical protein